MYIFLVKAGRLCTSELTRCKAIKWGFFAKKSVCFGRILKEDLFKHVCYTFAPSSSQFVYPQMLVQIRSVRFKLLIESFFHTHRCKQILIGRSVCYGILSWRKMTLYRLLVFWSFFTSHDRSRPFDPINHIQSMVSLAKRLDLMVNVNASFRCNHNFFSLRILKENSLFIPSNDKMQKRLYTAPNGTSSVLSNPHFIVVVQLRW